MSIGSNYVSSSLIRDTLLKSGNPISTNTHLFIESNNAGGLSSGNFHNYNNMGLTNSLSFKEAIFDPFNSQDNLAFSNWIGYDHNIYWTVDFVLENAGSADVEVELWFGSSDTASNDQFYTLKVTANTTDTQSSFITSLNSFTTGYSGYGGNYWIHMTANSTDNTLTQFMDVISASASDTDGVGSGTTRTTYTSLYGTHDFLNQSNPFTNWIVAGINQNNGIPWNKRTTFYVYFY